MTFENETLCVPCDVRTEYLNVIHTDFRLHSLGTQKKTALARPSNDYQLLTRPPVREGTPHKQTRNCLKIGPRVNHNINRRWVCIATFYSPQRFMFKLKHNTFQKLIPCSASFLLVAYSLYSLILTIDAARLFSKSLSSAVGVMSGYGLNEGSGFESRWSQKSPLLHIAQTGSRTHPTSYPVGPVGKTTAAWSYHSPPTSAEVKKMWIYTSASPSTFMV
jgi:hypothetical protein